MGWLLVITAGILFWTGSQIALADGEPGLVVALHYAGWVLLLLALLRWLVPTWHPVLRLLIAFFVPVAIAAIIVGAWLRFARGRE